MAETTSSPARGAVWTVLDVLRWTTSRFTERGLGSPRLDAELLAAHAFALTRVQLYTQFDRPLDPDELTKFRELVRRRQAGEPVAYLTGHKEFWSLDLQVDDRVLIPRPDTETAVEEALERLPADSQAHVVDVGTGSGAIALALAKSRPGATVVGVDLSPGAIVVARGNGERLGVAVTFLQGDLLAPLAGGPPLDLVVANLPYIPTVELEGLPLDVRAEPRGALDGGSDGLVLVRRLLAGLGPVLRPGGSVVLEIGDGQAEATRDLCAQAGLVGIRTRRDLGGIERVVAAERKAGA